MLDKYKKRKFSHTDPGMDWQYRRSNMNVCQSLYPSLNMKQSWLAAGQKYERGATVAEMSGKIRLKIVQAAFATSSDLQY